MKDYTYLYSTRILKTFDEDQADILAVIRAKLTDSSGVEVHLINYYKGLPVSFKARIVGIDKNALEMDIAPEQAVVMAAERYTFIRSALFKNPLLAQAQFVSVRHKAASLCKLCFVEIMAERRRHIRLELEPPVKAAFNSSSGIVRGMLVELSMAGAVMSVTHPFAGIMDEETTLTAMIPDTEQNTTYNIKLPAQFVEVSEESQVSLIRFSITADDRISDRIIAKYLYHRQVDIIRELKETAELGLAKQSSAL
jgi:hypothetical protein